MQAGGLAGTAFWMMAAPSYPDFDGFTVYFSRSSPSGSGDTAAGGIASSQPGRAQQAPQPGGRTAAVIRQHAATVALLNGRPAVAYGQLPHLVQQPGSSSGPPAGASAAAPPHHLPLPAVGGGQGQVVHSGGSSSGGGRFCYCYCCCPQM